MPRSQLELDIPTWGGRRAADALAFVKAKGRRERAPCFICGEAIDYSIPSTEPDGCTVQHVKSRKHFPQLTWLRSNWRPAHRSCNGAAGAGETVAADLDGPGVTSTDW